QVKLFDTKIAVSECSAPGVRRIAQIHNDTDRRRLVGYGVKSTAAIEHGCTNPRDEPIVVRAAIQHAGADIGMISDKGVVALAAIERIGTTVALKDIVP